MRKVLVRSALVLCINVVIAPKKVTEKVKKWEKIATLWLFLSHRGCHMAPRLQKHEYLLATMVQSDFEHFRMSGSIITWELFLSLTSCFRSCSFFKKKCLFCILGYSEHFIFSWKSAFFCFFKVGTGEPLTNLMFGKFTKTWDLVDPPPGWDKIPTFPKISAWVLPWKHYERTCLVGW